jgi:hypothetical protein
MDFWYLMGSSLIPLLKKTIKTGINKIFEGDLHCPIRVDFFLLQEIIQISKIMVICGSKVLAVRWTFQLTLF